MTSDTGDSELERNARRRIGTTLRGKYRIESVIGLGGMAVVYKATHRNQAEFAVKMLHPELSIREDVRTRFVREGYAANSVKHPGVVLVVDDDVAEDGAAFIVMELLDGAGCETLWEQCGGRMPVAAACSVGQQLLDVLASAHVKGVVHRDLKPANLFVTREGRVKVLDFGIARVRDVAAGSATMTGMLLGTPAFMGPEQALAKASEIDAQTDIWAVGATLFTMLSGALVHEADNAQQILIKAATQKARSLSDAAPNVPKQVVEVIDRALAFDKADRWPSAAAMRDALAKACELSAGEAPSMGSLARLLGAKKSSEEEPRSPAAIAETFASDATASDSSDRVGVAAAGRGATVALPPASSPGAVGPISSPAVASPALSSPAGSARQLMGMSTAQPIVATHRSTTASGSRGAALAAAVIATLAAAGTAAFFFVRHPGRGEGERPTAGLVASEAPSTAPIVVASAIPSGASATASTASAEPSPAVASAAPPQTSPGIATPIAGGAPAGREPNRPAVARPALPASATALRPSASAAAVPSGAASASTSARGTNCRNVPSVDADGQTHFKKVCD